MVTIRQRLALLVLACVVPALVAAGLLIAYNYQHERQSAVSAATSLSKAAVADLDRDFVNIQAVLHGLATSDGLKNGNFAAFHAQAARAGQRLNAVAIVLTDASGQQVVNTNVPWGTPLPMDGRPASAKGLFAQGKPIVSDLFTGKLLNTRLFSVAVPVEQDGAVKYALAAGLTPARVTDILRQQGLPAHWIATIADSTGTIVARSHQMDRFVGHSVSPGLWHELGRRSEGTFEGTSLEGVPVLTSFARSKATGWSVALGIPQEEVVRNLWASVLVAMGAASALLLAGFAAAWHIGSRISQSILTLAQPAFALGHGRKVALPPLYFQEADVVGEALSTAADLLQQASSAVSLRDARLAAILDSALDGIISVDEDQHVILYNRAAAELFGWPRHEAIGRPLVQFLPARFRESHAAHVAKFGREGLSHRTMGHGRTVTALARDGREFPVEASISVVEEQGRPIYTVVLRDISERLRTQEALERSNADLRQFAYVASHDLKGPLRSIGGMAQLLNHSYGPRLDTRGVDMLHRLSAAAARLERLTDDLLQLAQVDAEAPQLAAVDCQEVVDEALQLLEEPVRGAQAKVEVNPLPRVLGSRTELLRLFIHLLSNAVKYRGSRPVEVRVSARPSDEGWVVSVADNGPGIAPEYFDSIFDVFQRLHKHTEYEGTGMGLAMCRRIATRHGGRIWVESVEGQGSTFNVALRALPP